MTGGSRRRGRALAILAILAAGAATAWAAEPPTPPAAAAAAATASAATVPASPARPLRRERLAEFRDTEGWTVGASDQVLARTRRDADGSLCLDVDFSGVSGYAVLRRERPVDWPAHFELGLRLKALGAVNDVQLKFVDDSGDNVWWLNRPNATLPGRLIDWRIRQRQLEFAWGPIADKRLQRTRFIELVIAAGREGGRSTLCAAALELRERVPEPAVPPEPLLRTQGRTVLLDAGLTREFNGVWLQWPPAPAHDLAYTLESSEDGRQWQPLRQVRGSDGGADALWLPESEARWLRVRRERGSGLPRIALRTPAQWPDRHAMLAELAAGLPRGDLPRSFLGQQHYWTLVGVDGGGARSGLIGEDGAIELGRAGPSLEPAVLLPDGRRVTWAQAQVTHTLREGYLPQPAVHWSHPQVGLRIEAAADGPAGAPSLLARYTLVNPTDRPQTLRLVLVLRPWQVNPPQQFLTTPGGISPVRRLRWDAARLAIDGRPQVVFTRAPQRGHAWGFDAGLGLDPRVAGTGVATVDDPQGLASAAGVWRVTLAPGAQARIGWVASLGPEGVGAPPARLDAATLDSRFERAADAWRPRLGRLQLQLPPSAQPLADTVRSTLAQMLMSRAGPALRPGTRAYARTWIRDGAMMVGGLLRLGEVDAARDFVDDFARYLFDSGKVPCCVDQRGADPVAENDSHGQYLHAVAEVWRHTRDQGFLERHATRVMRVVAYQEGLRQASRTPQNREAGRRHYFGLLPPSISHEGYFDKPAWSYWDNFWGLRGLKDAVEIARALGQPEAAARWQAAAEEFESEIAASVAATARQHGIDHVAGAADRGDFDATSTSVALSPAQARLPEALLRQTFERYAREARARAEGRRRWTDYTPYEWRNVGALLRLGQMDDAHRLVDFLMADRRPAAWNQWAEVVLPDPRQARFLGDMPHAWVGSDYLRAALEHFAYEREADRVLVLGAGLRSRWMREGDIAIGGLSTAMGPVGWRLSRRPGGWTLQLPARPAGATGWVWRWPDDLPLPRVRDGGTPRAWPATREWLLPEGPAELHFDETDPPAPPTPR